MQERLKSARGRIALVAAVAALVVAGSFAAGASVFSTDSDRVAAAESTEAQRAALVASEAAAAEATAHQSVVDDGTALADEGTISLNASAGKVNDSVRTPFSNAINVLRAAITSGSEEQIEVASKTVTSTGRVVTNAMVAGDAKQVRVAAEAEEARVAAQAQAEAVAAAAAAVKAEEARVAAEANAARIAADAEVARVAAVTERAQVEAKAEAEDAAAAAVQYVDLAGSVAVVGWQVAGNASSTFVADGATGACQMFGGYADLKSGASVTIYDERNWVIGTGALSAGTASGIEQQSGGGYVGTCNFGFRVSVPEGKFYQIEVTQRGKVAVSRAEIGFVALSPS